MIGAASLMAAMICFASTAAAEHPSGNAACGGDNSQQDISCRELTESFLLSLRGATREEVLAAMGVQGGEPPAAAVAARAATKALIERPARQRMCYAFVRRSGDGRNASISLSENVSSSFSLSAVCALPYASSFVRGADL
jgi:hypothetical protein